MWLQSNLSLTVVVFGKHIPGPESESFPGDAATADIVAN